jgi:hypothetical protein
MHDVWDKGYRQRIPKGLLASGPENKAGAEKQTAETFFNPAMLVIPTKVPME